MILSRLYFFIYTFIHLITVYLIERKVKLKGFWNMKYKENYVKFIYRLWVAPNLVRHCGLLSFNATTKLMCKTPTGFLNSKCLLVAGLIFLCNYCCENFFKTVEQLKMEQCDKSKWRSLNFVVAMWFGFFSVKRSLTLWISIKTTSACKCQHPELKAITYVVPSYKPHLYIFWWVKLDFFVPDTVAVFDFIDFFSFSFQGRVSADWNFWYEKECRTLLFFTSKLICINSTMKGLQEPWNPGKKKESIFK